MSLRSRLFDQFRMPRGMLGRLAGRFMSKRPTNLRRSQWTVELIDLKPGDRVLELGYGPGIGIDAVLAHLTEGRIVGIDHSATMQAMATKRVRNNPSPVKPDLRVGDARAVPDDIGTFDKIFSCNVWLFWKDPVAVFEQLRPHLEPGGIIAVAHLPRAKGATREATVEAGHTIADQLARAGYTDIRKEVLELDPVPVVCVLATRVS